MAEAAGRQEKPDPVVEDAMLRPSLIVGAVLVAVIMFGGYVLVRSTRRSTKAGGREETRPSSIVDVSVAHRLREYDSGVEPDNDGM